MGMSKTAALAASRGRVRIYRGRRCGFDVRGPRVDTQTDGATISFCAIDWDRAQGTATRWRARIALRLIGLSEEDAQCGVHWAFEQGETSAPGIVNAVLNGVPTK